MKRPVKIGLVVVAIFVGLMLAAVVVVKVVFTKERILAMLTPRIEEAINRQVSIGDAGISFWGGIGVWLGDVTVDNREGFSEEPFLTIHKLEFKARFWPLLAGRVELDRVLLHYPSMLLEYNAAGASNLDDLLARKPSADTTKTAAMPGETALAAPVTVDHFVMDGGQFVIVNAQPERRIDIDGLSLDLKTAPGEHPALIAFEAGIGVDSMSVVGAVRNFSINEGSPRAYLKGEFNRQESAVTLDTVGLDWFGALLSLQGRVQYHESITEVQFNAHLSKTEIAGLIDQAVIAGILDNRFRVTGTAVGEAEVSFVWPLPAGTVPEWNAWLDVSNVTWQPDLEVSQFAFPRLEIRGEERALSWTIASGTLPGGTFSSTGTIDQLFAADREVSARLAFQADAAAYNGVTQPEYGIELAGNLSADVNAFGSLKDWKQLSFTGKCRSQNLTLIDTSWTVDTVSLAIDLQLDGKDVRVNDLTMQARHSSASATGSIFGLIPAALASFEPPNVPRAELTVMSPYSNLDEFFEEEAVVESSDTTGTSDTTATAAAPPDTAKLGLPTISATGTFTCDTMIYSEMTITSITSPFVFRDNILTLDPIGAQVYTAHASGALRWDINDWDKPSFAAKAQADSIEANDFMTRYFGWAGGLFGKTKFSGEFAGRGRDRFEILPTLVASGRATMDAGEIVTAPLLNSIGDKLSIKGMDQAHALRDFLLKYRMENGRVIADTLHLTTNDAKYAAVGSYSLDGFLDFAVTINYTGAAGGSLGDLARGKDLRFTLRGTVDNPLVTINAGDAGKAVLDNLLTPAPGDSASLQKKATDLLKGLFNPKKKP